MPLRVVSIGLIVIMVMTIATPGFSQAPDADIEPVQPSVTPTITTTLPPLPGTSIEGPCLTLDDAVNMAVMASPVFATAVERVLRAQNQVDEADAAGRFKITISPQFSRTGPASTITLPGPDGQPRTVTTTPPSVISTTASISQPIDVFGRIKYARQISNLNLDIQEYGEAQTLQQLIADTKTAYYNVLRAEGNVEVAKAAIAAAQERLEVARAQFDAGVVARFDVTRAEVDVANLQQTLTQAEAQLGIAKSTLNRIIGINVNEPYTLQDQPVSVDPVVIDITTATQVALERRPEVQQSATAVNLNRRNVRFVSTENKPTFSVFAATTTASETGAFSSGNTTYQYGISANWPIWDGGVTRARVAQARNDLEISRQTLETTNLGVAADVRSSALNVMEASRRIQSAQANVNLAEESLRLAQVRYQEGVSTEVEVANAEAALTQARQNLVSARFDYLAGLAQFQRATATQPEYPRFAAITSPAPPIIPVTQATLITPAIPDQVCVPGETIAPTQTEGVSGGVTK